MAIIPVSTSSMRLRGATMHNDPELRLMAESAIEACLQGDPDRAIVSTGATGEGWRVGQANGIVKADTGKAWRWLLTEGQDLVEFLDRHSMTLVWGTTTKGDDGPLDLPEGHKAVTCHART